MTDELGCGMGEAICAIVISIGFVVAIGLIVYLVYLCFEYMGNERKIGKEPITLTQSRLARVREEYMKKLQQGKEVEQCREVLKFCDNYETVVKGGKIKR